MTREEMLAEFGSTGVQNPRIIDLITVDPAADTVVLVMTERRGWGQAPHQLKEIEEKVNRYMAYVLDGFLAEQYPQYVGKSVRVRLDCAEPPAGEAARFVEALSHTLDDYGLSLAVNVVPPAA